ncbi:MAG: anthranilate phosphoribosyltransferase [Gammaproteobacteria bacterium]|nr:anthranilate phosphoribosyltransferase [Gammaproteobacteria bacterium]NNC97818.1 anthranilate phosphoribosyltransferase [Gammaproteobacteria bacterium]NNM13285.1 anthranilate phosphoribosyltransferase [Gammaproteobacteria bacterium]
MNENINTFLEALYAGEDLQRQDTREIFESLLKGELNEPTISALLIALKCKGETPEEIAGAAEAMREACDFPALKFASMDCCGTGGDGSNTINVSTIVSFVLAAAGIKVVKHGNRSVSSKSGSADVLEKLGIPLAQDSDLAIQALDTVNFCFLFAPHFHSGVKYAMPVRRSLSTRTMFNLLGPLVNPAKPPYQMMGVYDAKLCEPLAETLQQLGCQRALVVNGQGLDEITITGTTHAAFAADGEVKNIQIDPADVGLKYFNLETIKGDDAEYNTQRLIAILKGEGTDAENATIALNAGTSLWVHDMASDWQQGYRQAVEILASGAGFEQLQKIQAFYGDV